MAKNDVLDGSTLAGMGDICDIGRSQKWQKNGHLDAMETNKIGLFGDLGRSPDSKKSGDFDGLGCSKSGNILAIWAITKTEKMA